MAGEVIGLILRSAAGLARRGRDSGQGLDRRDQAPDVPLDQPATSLLCPRCARQGAAAEDRVGHRPDVLLRMPQFDDLGRLREVLIGQPPNPGRSIPQDQTTTSRAWSSTAACASR